MHGRLYAGSWASVTPYDGSVPWASPPCHIQGSADRVDQEGDFQQQAERFLDRRREWRGEARPGYRYLNFREFFFHALG